MEDSKFVFVLEIEVVGGELEMSLDEAGQVEQKKRRGADSGSLNGKRNRKIKEEKVRRQSAHGGGGSGGHSHKNHSGPHVPIILISKAGQTDTVIFRSRTNQFTVDVPFDEDLIDHHNPRPERTPFGWDRPQASKLVGDFHQVTAEFSGPGTHGAIKQMFYKCTVWSDGVDPLDPDFICDR